jgi:hypothetical protein
MAAPNIVTTATINGKTAVANVGTTAAAIVTNSAGSNKALKINTLIISNIDGAAAADITVDLFRSSVAYMIASTITVPADASLVVISKENTIYLEEGDTLRLTASAVGDLQAICSYEDITQ